MGASGKFYSSSTPRTTLSMAMEKFHQCSPPMTVTLIAVMVTAAIIVMGWVLFIIKSQE